jgi:hypothetical protein
MNDNNLTLDNLRASVAAEPAYARNEQRHLSRYWYEIGAEPDSEGLLPTVRLWITHDRGERALTATLSLTEFAVTEWGTNERFAFHLPSLRVDTLPMPRFSAKVFGQFTDRVLRDLNNHLAALAAKAAS